MCVCVCVCVCVSVPVCVCVCGGQSGCQQLTNTPNNTNCPKLQRNQISWCQKHDQDNSIVWQFGQPPPPPFPLPRQLYCNYLKQNQSLSPADMMLLATHNYPRLTRHPINGGGGGEKEEGFLVYRLECRVELREQIVRRVEKIIGSFWPPET